MIKVSFFQDAQGFLRRLEVNGHESVKHGELALGCAGVSFFVRSFVRLCQLRGLDLECNAPDRGKFSFFLKNLPQAQEDFYSGAVALLRQAFLDLGEEKAHFLEMETVLINL